MSEGGSGERERPARDPDQRMIRRWLRIADEFVRRPNGKKGGERQTSQRPPKSDDRRGPPS